MSEWGPWSSVDWVEPTPQGVLRWEFLCLETTSLTYSKDVLTTRRRYREYEKSHVFETHSLEVHFQLNRSRVLLCGSPHPLRREAYSETKNLFYRFTARRREAPSVVLKDQDSALFGVAPEYDRLVVAACLFCDAVRRIECIAQHMLDEHPEEIEKRTSEVSLDRVHENNTDEPQQSESWFVESQQIEHGSRPPAPPGGYIETLVIKKRNPSRRRLRPSNTTPEIDVASTSSQSSTSGGVVPVLQSNSLKRGPVKSPLEPALKRKFSLEKDREYDPNEHCGVVSEPNGKPCCYALGACKAHPVRHRRAVPGRRTSYDELVLEHRARAISGVAPPDRVATETPEGSISAESPAASTGSKSDLRDFEVAAEAEYLTEPDKVPLPNGVPLSLRTSFTNGVVPRIGMPLETRVSSRVEVPSQEIEVSDEIEFLAGTEIVGELPTETEISADSMVFAEIEVTPENKTPSETEGRSRFTFENSSTRTDGADDVGLMAEDLEITSEEILTTTPTTMGGVPTTTGGILHITDAAALTNHDVSQLDGPKSGDELTTIYEVIAINSPDSMGNLTIENGGETEQSASIDEAFLMSHASLEAGLTMVDTQTPQKDEQTNRKATMYLNDVTTSACRNGAAAAAERTNVTKADFKSSSLSDGSEFLVDPRLDATRIFSNQFHSEVTAAATASQSLPSPFLVESSTLLSEEVESRAGEELRTDAQNRSSVFLDDTANRFAVIVDPNKDTILSSLLFPSRYAASQNKSELSLRSTTSSTDQLFSEPATAVVSDNGPVTVQDGKLRNLLTCGKPKGRSRLHYRRTERASQDSPGSSGEIANASIPEAGNGVVEIPIKKPRIHWMMPTQANHMNRICRLSGENLPEYLRVYLRRPQLADLREQQGSPMSMSDDLSEVLE